MGAAAPGESLSGERLIEYLRGHDKAVIALEKIDATERITLPSTRFHRHQGIYAGMHFDPEGNPISEEAFEARRSEWLPTADDRAYVASLMHACYEPGKMANWIAAPARGINGQPVDYEYVRV